MIIRERNLKTIHEKNLKYVEENLLTKQQESTLILLDIYNEPDLVVQERNLACHTIKGLSRFKFSKFTQNERTYYQGFNKRLLKSYLKI